MNRLGVYDVDAAFEKLSLQTAEEFGLDAILERLVRADAWHPLRLKSWTTDGRC